MQQRGHLGMVPEGGFAPAGGEQPDMYAGQERQQQQQQGAVNAPGQNWMGNSDHGQVQGYSNNNVAPPPHQGKEETHFPAVPYWFIISVPHAHKHPKIHKTRTRARLDTHTVHATQRAHKYLNTSSHHNYHNHDPSPCASRRRIIWRAVAREQHGEVTSPPQLSATHRRSPNSTLGPAVSREPICWRSRRGRCRGCGRAPLLPDEEEEQFAFGSEFPDAAAVPRVSTHAAAAAGDPAAAAAAAASATASAMVPALLPDFFGLPPTLPPDLAPAAAEAPAPAGAGAGAAAAALFTPFPCCFP